jgi:DNA-binding beta-propeller fold protein YncE
MRRRALASFGLALAVALGICVGSAATVAGAAGHEFTEEIVPGPTKEKLKDACGVAVDPTSGRVFVSSYYTQEVVVFGPKNSSSKKREVEETIQLGKPPSVPAGKSVGGPCDLALDSAGNLYVNNWHYNVVRLSPVTPGSLAFDTANATVIDSHEPTGVAVDSADHVFVDDRTYIAEYDSTGAPVLDGGEPVRIGLGSLGDGYGVAVSDFSGSPGSPATAGRVYVADAADGTVKAYDPSGDASLPKQVIDGGGTPRLGFTRLVDSDLAVDPVDGHLYVVDNLEPFFEEPEAVAYEFSPLGHYRGTVPGNVESGFPSLVVSGEPSSIAIFERDVYLTSGNYFDDQDQPKHSTSMVRVYEPATDAETRLLEVTKTGAGAGTVFSSSPAGLGCGTACKGEFTLGITVTLTATPAPHSRFADWTGCDSEPAPGKCAMAMSEDRAVSAEFEPIPQHQLSVARSGSGAGTVASVPAGIDCGTACMAEFDEASAASPDVILTATADSHSAFAGWSGCDSEPDPGRCAVSMSAARSVTARFDAVVVPPPPPPPPPGQRILSVYTAATGAAAGTVTSEPAGIACGATCAQAFGQGTAVTLVARPAPGSAFLGWGGCDSAGGLRCTVVLGTDKSVVAAFGAGTPGPLRIGALTVHGDSATLAVTVPAAGTLSASGPGLRPASALPLAAGRVGLRLRLSAAGRRSLARTRRHQLGVKVALAFTPFDGGGSVRAHKAVTFRAGGDRR